jgi:hypothetical protein
LLAIGRMDAVRRLSVETNRFLTAVQVHRSSNGDNLSTTLRRHLLRDEGGSHTCVVCFVRVCVVSACSDRIVRARSACTHNCPTPNRWGAADSARGDHACERAAKSDVESMYERDYVDSCQIALAALCRRFLCDGSRLFCAYSMQMNANRASSQHGRESRAVLMRSSTAATRSQLQHSD